VSGPPTAPAAPERTFHRLSPLTPVVRGAVFVVAVAATTWDDLFNGQLGTLALILLGVLFAGAVYGFLSWLRTKYWIDATELRIDTGVLYHQSRRIRIDRLQGIDIVQPFVARIFGLAELKMDVAGGDAEGSLAFLPLAEAHRVREVLLARRDAVRRTTPHTEGADRDADDEPGWAPPDHDIAVLDLPTLLLSMVLSPEAVSLVVGGILFGVALLLNGVVVVAPALPVVGGLALISVRKLSAYYGFTVSQTRVGLQVRRGLLERATQTIALARVQGVVVSEPIMWRRMGWAKLDVSVAGAGGVSESDGRPSATTVMPVAPLALVRELAEHLLRGDDTGLDVGLDAVPLPAPPRSARWLDPVTRRFMGAGIGDELVVTREGWLTRRTHAVRHARVQSVRLSQGPVQRRLGLADVHVDSPPGPVHVRARHRSAAEARTFFEEEEARSKAARAAAR
jgi:putative membrane protein